MIARFAAERGGRGAVALEITRTSAQASGAPADTKARMLAGIDAWLAC